MSLSQFFQHYGTEKTKPIIGQGMKYNSSENYGNFDTLVSLLRLIFAK